MSLLLPIPVLAADFGTLLSIVFVVIAFLSWVSNLLSNSSNPPARPAENPRPARPAQPAQVARPRDDRLQDEIDIFLREVGGKKAEKTADVEAVEIVEFEDAVPPRTDYDPDAKRLPRTRKAHVSTIAGRSLAGPEEVGGGIKARIAEHKQDRLGVNLPLGHGIEASVNEHLGHFTGQSLTSSVESSVAETNVGSPITQRVITLLNDPEGVRQAILVSEILAPPLARRS